MSAVAPVQIPEQILMALDKQPELSLAQVALMVDRSVRTIERAVAKLKQQGKLSYHGPNKGGRWEVH